MLVKGVCVCLCMLAHIRKGFFSVVSNSRTKGAFQKPKDRLATTQLSQACNTNCM